MKSTVKDYNDDIDNATRLHDLLLSEAKQKANEFKILSDFLYKRVINLENQVTSLKKEVRELKKANDYAK